MVRDYNLNPKRWELTDYAAFRRKTDSFTENSIPRNMNHRLCGRSPFVWSLAKRKKKEREETQWSEFCSRFDFMVERLHINPIGKQKLMNSSHHCRDRSDKEKKMDTKIDNLGMYSQSIGQRRQLQKLSWKLKGTQCTGASFHGSFK
mgnify:CR=1 FL=1